VKGGKVGTLSFFGKKREHRCPSVMTRKKDVEVRRTGRGVRGGGGRFLSVQDTEKGFGTIVSSPCNHTGKRHETEKAHGEKEEGGRTNLRGEGSPEGSTKYVQNEIGAYNQL